MPLCKGIWGLRITRDEDFEIELWDYFYHNGTRTYGSYCAWAIEIQLWSYLTIYLWFKNHSDNVNMYYYLCSSSPCLDVLTAVTRIFPHSPRPVPSPVPTLPVTCRHTPRHLSPHSPLFYLPVSETSQCAHLVRGELWAQAGRRVRRTGQTAGTRGRHGTSHGKKCHLITTLNTTLNMSPHHNFTTLNISPHHNTKHVTSSQDYQVTTSQH